MDFLLLFAYSWARRRFRDEFTSTVRDSLPHPWLHHAELVGKGDHFSTRVPASSPNSPTGVDRPSLPRSDAHKVRALARCDAHRVATLIGYPARILGRSAERTRLQRGGAEPRPAIGATSRLVARRWTCSFFSRIGESFSGARRREEVQARKLFRSHCPDGVAQCD